MKRHVACSVIVWIAVAAGSAFAQTEAKPALRTNRLTSYAEFGGTSNSEGQIYELSTSMGYDFTSHFGADVGVPFLFIRPSSSAGGSSTNGVGNPFLDVRTKFLNPVVNFGSVLTGFAPVGDSRRGLSTGRATYDWTNHFDRRFSFLKPFANVGIANTTLSTEMFIRPYTTLGFNTHVQGGTTYDIWKFIDVGGSAYDILPSGQQTVFSRVGRGAVGRHHRVFETSQQTTGSADIARDNGFSAWIDATPRQVVNLELGFTRSMRYDLNSVSFLIGFNLKPLYNRHVQ